MERCYYRKIVTQGIRKDGTLTKPTLRYELADHVEWRRKRGQYIASDEQCPGTIRVNVELGSYDYDESHLEVNWLCTEQHLVNNDGRFPFNADNLNIWLNDTLGFTDSSAYCKCQSNLMVCAKCNKPLWDYDNKDEKGTIGCGSNYMTKTHRIHELCPRE